MAPLVVNSASSVFGFNQVVTFSAFDCSGTDTLLLVQIASDRNAAVPFATPTYNGVNLTLLAAPGGLASGTLGDHRIWYMIGPTGVHDVICTLAVAGTRGACGAVLLTGVHQTTPFGTAVNTVLDNSNPLTEGAVTSAGGELVVDFVLEQTSSPTKDASQTQIFQTAVDADCQGQASTKPGAASISMIWTAGANEFWSAMAVPVKPPGGSPPATTGTFTGLAIGLGR